MEAQSKPADGSESADTKGSSSVQNVSMEASLTRVLVLVTGVPGLEFRLNSSTGGE